MTLALFIPVGAVGLVGGAGSSWKGEGAAGVGVGTGGGAGVEEAPAITTHHKESTKHIQSANLGLADLGSAGLGTVGRGGG